MHKRFVVRVIHPCAGVTDAPSDPHPLLNQHAWTTTFRQYFDRAVDKYWPRAPKMGAAVKRSFVFLDESQKTRRRKAQWKPCQVCSGERGAILNWANVDARY